MSALLDRLARWKTFDAVVVGDFMLDEMVHGDADRLSPDAPIPVLHVRREERRAGGAANVSAALAALGGRVRCVGVTGDDAPAGMLRQALAAPAIDTSGLVADGSRPTTVKRSYVGLAQHRHPQKMFRADVESRHPISPEVEASLLRRFEAALPGADVVCIEDYAKGVCTPPMCAGMIARARAAGVPVFVDPARLDDYARYRGATVLTPNRTEAARAAGLGEDEAPDSVRAARSILARTDAEAVVVTLDREGALLVERGGRSLHVPTQARRVYDVSGAGDQFIGALAAARANGCPWEDAVRLANTAAGLEVEEFGAVAIPLERVHQSLLARDAADAGKSRTLEQVLVEVSARRRQGQEIAFTNGCFDLLHAGHIALLTAAARGGRFLVVGLNDDASVRRLKGPGRPVNGQEERARILGALEPVGAVVLFPQETPIELIERIRPDVLVKGADYAKSEVVGASLVESWGGRVELVDLVEGRSTSGTIERVRGT